MDTTTKKRQGSSHLLFFSPCVNIEIKSLLAEDDKSIVTFLDEVQCI